MIKINLLPIEKKEKEKIAKQNLGFLIVMLSMFIIIAVVIILLITYNSNIKTQTSDIENNIKNIESSNSSFQEIKEQVSLIKDRIGEMKNSENQVIFSDVLDTLSKNTPETIILTDFSYTIKNNSNLKISGNSATQTDVIKYKEQLENSGSFENVNFESGKKETVNDKEVINFNITANLKGNSEK